MVKVAEPLLRMHPGGSSGNKNNIIREMISTLFRSGLWEGKGSEPDEGDFSEYTFIGNLECPECSQWIAFWQAPLK